MDAMLDKKKAAGKVVVLELSLVVCWVDLLVWD